MLDAVFSATHTLRPTAAPLPPAPPPAPHARGMGDVDPAEARRVRDELISKGYSVCRGLLPSATIDRARSHLEKCVDKHLSSEFAAGKLGNVCAGLPLEERMAAAYHDAPEQAPCSWVAQTRTSFVFQQLLFRDPALCALVRQLTHGREVIVASRYNCRCKLPGTSGASFPWHQDHAFFRMQYLLKREAPKRLLAAWAPLVHVDAANGGVELCPASHDLGFLRHGRHDGFLAIAPDGKLPANAATDECELPTLEPGDVLLFTDLTLHRSGLNRSSTARWSADWAYELLDGDPITPLLDQLAPPDTIGSPSIVLRHQVIHVADRLCLEPLRDALTMGLSRHWRACATIVGGGIAASFLLRQGLWRRR